MCEVEHFKQSADQADDLEDAIVAVLHRAGTELAALRALRFITDFEPELLLPHLTFAGGDLLLAKCALALEPAFARFVAEPRRAAEWVARVGLTFWFSPTAPVSLLDESALRTYVATFIVPAVDPSPSDLVPSRG